jgi:hypothetical protein
MTLPSRLVRPIEKSTGAGTTNLPAGKKNQDLFCSIDTLTATRRPRNQPLGPAAGRLGPARLPGRHYRPDIRAHEGRIMKLIGDGVWVEFRSEK